MVRGATAAACTRRTRAVTAPSPSRLCSLPCCTRVHTHAVLLRRSVNHAAPHHTGRSSPDPALGPRPGQAHRAAHQVDRWRPAAGVVADQAEPGHRPLGWARPERCRWQAHRDGPQEGRHGVAAAVWW